MLTAAHCLAGVEASSLEVEIGGESYAPARALPHPEWRESRVTNDIGVIFLPEAPPVAHAEVGAADLLAGDIVEASGFAPGHLHSATFSVRVVVSPTIYLESGGQLCPGDSGGPQFVAGALVSLNSRSDCSSQAIGELVAPHLEWLISLGF